MYAVTRPQPTILKQRAKGFPWIREYSKVVLKSCETKESQDKYGDMLVAVKQLNVLNFTMTLYLNS